VGDPASTDARGTSFGPCPTVAAVRRGRCRRPSDSRGVACAGVVRECFCGPPEGWRQGGVRRGSPARRGGPRQRYTVPPLTRFPPTTPCPSSLTPVSPGPAVWTPPPRSSRASSAAAPGAQQSGAESQVPEPPPRASKTAAPSTAPSFGCASQTATTLSPNSAVAELSPPRMLPSAARSPLPVRPPTSLRRGASPSPPPRAQPSAQRRR